MTRCEDHRRALARHRDGEAAGDATREALAHAATCADCGVFEAVGSAVRARLLERAGPPVRDGDDTAPVDGLREAVLARLARGDALVLDLDTFLRRSAAAAAAVLIAGTAAAFLRGFGDRSPVPVPGPGLDRDGILAAIVTPRLGPGR